MGEQQKNPAVKVAVITGCFGVFGILLGFYLKFWQADPKALEVKGTICSFEKGEPLENAEIKIGGVFQRTYTMSDGKFNIEVDNPESKKAIVVTIMISKDGYETISFKQQIPANLEFVQLKETAKQKNQEFENMIQKPDTSKSITIGAQATYYRAIVGRRDENDAKYYSASQKNANDYATTIAANSTIFLTSLKVVDERYQFIFNPNTLGGRYWIDTSDIKQIFK